MRTAWSDFLDALVPPSADGYLELRSFNDARRLPPRQHFIKADALDREEQITQVLSRDLLDGYDCYMGVAERWTDQPTPDGRRGGKAACSYLRALFVDIDIAKNGLDEATIRAKLDAFVAPYSILVNSGGGLHVYWLSKDDAINLRADGEIAKTESILRRLAAALGGDIRATDVSRVLRVPGTLNWKPTYSPMPAVNVVEFRPEVRL